MKLPRLRFAAFLVAGIVLVGLPPHASAVTIDFTGSAGRISSDATVNGTDYNILTPPAANPLYFDGKIGDVNGYAVSNGDLYFGLTGAATATFSGLTYGVAFGAGGTMSITGAVSGVTGTNLVSGSILDASFQVICNDSRCTGGTGTIAVNVSPVTVNLSLLSLLGLSGQFQGSIVEDLWKVKLSAEISTGCFSSPTAGCTFHSTSLGSEVSFSPVPPVGQVPLPAGILMMGSVLLGAGGVVRWRRRSRV